VPRCTILGVLGRLCWLLVVEWTCRGYGSWGGRREGGREGNGRIKVVYGRSVGVFLLFLLLRFWKFMYGLRREGLRGMLPAYH